VDGLQCQLLGIDHSKPSDAFVSILMKKYVSMGTLKYISLILNFYLNVTELALHYYYH
jgi:hypothetical protein